MIHERHYTVAEANALLEQVEAILRALVAERDRLADPDAHALLTDAAPTNGGGSAGRQVGEAFAKLRRLLAAMEEAGIVVRDIDQGLIDFPAIREGREVYLCWRLGEHRVGWWHDLDAGYAGRRPLE